MNWLKSIEEVEIAELKEAEAIPPDILGISGVQIVEAEGISLPSMKL